MSKSSLSKIPFWDGKAKSFGIYVSKIKAYAEFVGIEDALDSVLMVNCPTQLKFAALDITKPDNQILGNFYSAQNLCNHNTRSGQESQNGTLE